MKRTITGIVGGVAALCAAMLPVPGTAQNDADRPVDLFVEGDAGYAGYRIPAIVRAADGALLAFALSVDNISAGLCTGTVSLPTIILLLLTTAIHFFALKLGLLSGKMLSDKTNGFAWLGGAILMVLAFLRLM